MNQRLRQERNVFLLFLGAVFVSLMSALPIVTASMPRARYATAEHQRPAAQLTFEQLDRNHDGFVDRAEALAQPGLETVFPTAGPPPDRRFTKSSHATTLAAMSPPLCTCTS